MVRNIYLCLSSSYQSRFNDLSNVIVYKHKKTGIFLFKLAIVIGLSWLIYDKLWITNSQIGFFDNVLNKFSSGPTRFFLFCVLLAPFNWLIEIRKWKSLTSPFEDLHWKEASEAILAGITLGVLTPSRLGEYGGRLLHTEEGKKPQALYAHFIGSLSQNIPTLLIGGTCSFVFFSNFYIANLYMSGAISAMVFALGFLVLIIYWENSYLQKWLNAIPGTNKWMNNVTIFTYNKNTLHIVALFSLLRYFIYMGQYILLLTFFGINVDLTSAIMGVGVIYLFQTGLPLPPALSIIARTQLALIVWSVFDNNQLSILAVPLTLWVINLLVPAIAGGIVLLTSNLQKQI